jgi:hypothetical protein
MHQGDAYACGHAGRQGIERIDGLHHLWNETGFGADSSYKIVQARRAEAVELDERFAREIGDMHLLASRQGVVFGQRGDEWIGMKAFALQAFGFNRALDERDIDHSIVERIDLSRSDKLGQGKRGVRMGCPECAYRFGDDTVARGADEA